MTAPRQVTKANDGARILFRFFQSATDQAAVEAYVREFTPSGDYVRLTRTCYKDDRGSWLRAEDLLLVAVLQEKVELTERPKGEKKRKSKPFPGEEWKDDEEGEN
jgi:hypothetical protein